MSQSYWEERECGSSLTEKNTKGKRYLDDTIIVSGTKHVGHHSLYPVYGYASNRGHRLGILGVKDEVLTHVLLFVFPLRRL